ncbi:shikimate dehydrogenase [Yimella sp. cx-573]|nr:shikimate dehydrogenase [Yimella sp. cx-573]
MHRAAVLGSPIQHSLSPVLHRAAYVSLGLRDWSYDRCEVDEAGLAGFLAELDDSWAGLSLTMPLKEQALVLADQCDPLALQTGAVNTLVADETGWTGYNTDVHGVVAALGDAGVGPGAGMETAMILGSGATARSALAAVAEIGVTRVVFGVRREARESTMAQARDHGIDATTILLTECAGHLHDIHLVISTLPAGAADGFGNDVLERGPVVPDDSVWLDAVYAGWPTFFAQAASAVGAQVVSGLEMLVHQAVRQVELMTGQTPDLGVVQAAGRAALARG